MEGLLNNSSCLAPALVATKLIIVKYMIRSHLVLLLRSDLDVQPTHLWSHFVVLFKSDLHEAGLLYKSSCLAPTVGVTKVIIVKYDFDRTLWPVR